MPRTLLWLTDIHLNFIPPARADAFFDALRARRPGGILLGGDIAEAHDVADYLVRFAKLQVPTWFVLGNHDYYFDAIARVREHVRELGAEHPQLVYLSEATQPLELAPGVGLVGHDGWADGRLGDYEHSLVSMTDFRLIEDFVGLTKRARWPKLQALGDEAAAHIRRVLPPALERFHRVLLLTHVPPLREACWHEGQLSDNQWAPFFTCKAMGDAILQIMSRRPDVQLTVLCGHTHGAGRCRPAANVEIITGGATYGEPAIQQVLEFA